MEKLLLLLVEPLVKDIKKIKIEKEREENRIKYILQMPKGDIAKVIGKSGKMIKAINSLLKLRAIKENMYASCELQEV